MKDTIESKAPRKRAAPRTAAKSKAGRKTAKPNSARTQRQRVAPHAPIPPVNASVEAPTTWKPLNATFRAAKSIWVWLEDTMMLIVDFMVSTIRHVKWVPV